MAESSICFLGSARYSQPLNLTDEKKFRMLSGLARIYVIGFSDNIKYQRFIQHARFYLFPLAPLPIVRQVMVFTLWPMLAMWFVVRHKVSVMVCQSPYEGFVGGLVKRVAGIFGRKVALIVESHGDFETALFLQRKVYFERVYRWLMSRAARYALRETDLLRAISDSTRRQLQSWAPNKPIVQFPAWTDIDTFLEAEADRSGERRQLILYAGVLTPLKGLEHLIEAFSSIASEFPNSQLLIVGGEENRTYSEKLRSLVNTLGLKERIGFVGQVSQKELAAYMCNAAVFVLPTLSEGLGRVIFEAMATGRAVVASQVGGIPEIIEEGVTGFLVPPADGKALAERLKWCLNNPNIIIEMGIRAKKRAREIFSTEAYLEKYRHLFQGAFRVTT